MSTDDLDARLAAAGEHWRAANTDYANVDFGEMAYTDRAVDLPVTDAPPQRRRRMRGMLASGAGVAAAIVATIVAVQLGGSTPTHRPQPPTGAAGVQVVCATDRPATNDQLLADGAVIMNRLKHMGAGGGTVRVQGSDSIVITAPGGSEESARGLCAYGRLDLRPLAMPAVALVPGKAIRNPDPYAALSFPVPTSEAAFNRLGSAQQHALLASLAQLDCSSISREASSAASYFLACDTGDNMTAKLAYLLGSTIVPGTEIAEATAAAPNASQGQTQWAVGLTLKPGARAIWAKYTGAHNTGNSSSASAVADCAATGTPCADYVAFVLDGVALSVPVSLSRIDGPATMISGNFTEESAKTLAGQLASGPLPAPLHVVSANALGHPRPLVGTDWRLVSVDGKASLGSDAPLKIDQHGQLTGTDGCNALGAHVTISGDAVTISNVITTDMACTDRKAGFAAQVARLDKLLSGTLQWSVQGDELTLSRNGTNVLVYRAAPPPTTDPKALVGVQWRLVAIAQDGPNGTASSVPPGATLTFDGRGNLSGYDGCNSMSGHAAVAAGRLEGVSYGGTLKACPNSSGNPETSLRSVLTGTVQWSIKDGQLSLTKVGVGTLTYRGADIVSPSYPASSTTR